MHISIYLYVYLKKYLVMILHILSFLSYQPTIKKLPHGNFPNQSKSEFRMVHYIKMITIDNEREFEPAISARKTFEETEWFPDNYEISLLGKCLYGLKDWDDVSDEMIV